MTAMKKVVADLFIADISERPEDFHIGAHTATDTRTKRIWWIANKGYGFKLREPIEIEIGNRGASYSWHGNRCYRAYVKFLASNLNRLLAL